ncbi:MAG: lytic transglycosylase F [Desulfobacter sp.]|nr:MAG: lytic transglycosylase F [Desulfobacter sp.]
MIRHMLVWAFFLIFLFPAGSIGRTIPRWTGDFDQLVDHRVIRALVPYSKTFYFLDKGRPRGLTYESLTAFEKMINTRLKSRHLKIHLVIIPTPRKELISSLVEGKGDIAAGNLTMTEERLKKVYFSHPFFTQATEILVSGPKSPKMTDIQDLAGQTIHVRFSSSYYASLVKLNTQFRLQKKKAIQIIRVDDFLEDEDLLEMLNAGMIFHLVMDSHKAKFWAKIFDHIVLHPKIVLRTKGQIAWAVRKGSPKLMEQINAFVETNKKGSLQGNILFERYLKNTRFVKPADQHRTNFEKTAQIFKKYGDQYQFDWLLLKALAFQESGINQNKKSHQGAVGIMQVMPSTAKDPNVNIGDIHLLDNNIHAGTKYLRFLKDRYFSDAQIDDRNQTLLALAAYNAGPRQVARLRKKAKELNLNPNIWFKNVEVAAAMQIGRETVQYVNNIFKYYIGYSRIHTIQDQKKEER